MLCDTLSMCTAFSEIHEPTWPVIRCWSIYPLTFYSNIHRTQELTQNPEVHSGWEAVSVVLEFMFGLLCIQSLGDTV